MATLVRDLGLSGERAREGDGLASGVMGAYVRVTSQLLYLLFRRRWERVDPE